MNAVEDAAVKINLTLDVGQKRADGFHDLDSIVAQFGPASDEITITLRPGHGAVRLVLKDKRPDAIAHEIIPKGAENLATKAAAAFVDAARIDNVDVWINLNKRLPAQAGLGAGSSDAAAVLRALSRLLPDRVSPVNLRALAATLGSDVPLFLSHEPARMSGRGEQLAALPTTLPTLHGVIARPAIGIPTGPAYAALDAVESRTPGSATLRLLAALADGANVESIAGALGNDFEAAVLDSWPDVGAAHRKVADAGALRALLCGSGSAVFGLARSREHALELTRRLAGALPWVKLVSSL